MPRTLSSHDLSSSTFTNAKVHTVKLSAGDCVYIPNYWWVQIKSDPTQLSVGVTHWYEISSTFVDLVMRGVRKNEL